MKTVGIAAEYNPFHRGHAVHLQESLQKSGGDAIVIAVMSGDFVQRGEAAVFSKFARAEAACRSGVDLVIELPLPWSLASAEGFAAGAVSLLEALHTDWLSFGSETANLNDLEEVAELFCRPDFPRAVSDSMKMHPNCSFPAARQELAEEQLGKKLPILQQPNNILAVEYLKAIRMHDWKIRPLPVLRQGGGHDVLTSSDLPSAAYIRSKMEEGRWPAELFSPEAEYVLHHEREKGRAVSDRGVQGLCMLSRLRFLSEEAFQNLPDAKDGAGERMYRALRQSTDYETFLRQAASRRLPLARVRRMAICAALGIGEDDSRGFPLYARVLAFNEKGKLLLHDLSRTAEVPLLTKAAHVRKLSGKAENDFQLGARAHDFYTLFYTGKEERTCGEDWRRGPALC